MTGGGRWEQTTLGSGVADLSRVTDLAGRHLYHDNIFAVTGLSAEAQGRAVRQHRQRVEARLAVEDSWPGDAGSPAEGGYRLDEVRAAYEEFQDPRRRLVDELLWLWGDADLGCGCPPSVHKAHDTAVRSHVTALRWESGHIPDSTGVFENPWDVAAAGWGALLERPDFRNHITNRIRALDDPRLRQHPPGDFLDGIARVLLSPFKEFASDPVFAPRLTLLCAGWQKFACFSAPLTELFEETVEESTERVNNGVRSVTDKQNARRYGDAVADVYSLVLPEFERLNALREFVPEYQQASIAHQVAKTLNNLAVALQGYHSGRNPTQKQRHTVISLAKKAYEIAPEADAETIKQNRDVISASFSGGGRVPRGVPAARTARYRGGASNGRGVCLFLVLGFVALVIQSFVMGLREAALTAFVALISFTVLGDTVGRVMDKLGGRR